MAKEIKYNTEARELLKEGVDALANAELAGRMHPGLCHPCQRIL